MKRYSRCPTTPPWAFTHTGVAWPVVTVPPAVTAASSLCASSSITPAELPVLFASTSASMLAMAAWSKTTSALLFMVIEPVLILKPMSWRAAFSCVSFIVARYAVPSFSMVTPSMDMPVIMEAYIAEGGKDTV